MLQTFIDGAAPEDVKEVFYSHGRSPSSQRNEEEGPEPDSHVTHPHHVGGGVNNACQTGSQQTTTWDHEPQDNNTLVIGPEPSVASASNSITESPENGHGSNTTFGELLEKVRRIEDIVKSREYTEKVLKKCEEIMREESDKKQLEISLMRKSVDSLKISADDAKQRRIEGMTKFKSFKEDVDYQVIKSYEGKFLS